MKKHIVFNPEISFGHVLQLIMLLGGLFAGYIAIDRRITVLETKIAVAENVARQNINVVSELVSNQRELLAVISSKLSKP